MDEHTQSNDSGELSELHRRLKEAEDTLEAIRQGEVDALLISDHSGDRVYTLRSADAPYRALVEQMRDGATTLALNGDILYCNQGFADLVGDPLERVVGGSIERYMDATDWPALWSAIQDGTGNLYTRVNNRKKGLLDAHISVSVVRLDDEDRRTLIVTDMSRLTKAQRESQSKDEFLAMLAHELRNPLGAIGGAVQVLTLADLENPSVVRARAVIQRQVTHMARLVDDLLDVARVMSGKITLNFKPTELSEAIRASVAVVMSNQESASRVRVTADQVRVLADPVRLEQIVGNLVSNALKFTPPEAAVIVSATVEGHEAVITVADQGCGIDLDLLPHIFDLFVQGQDSPDRSHGGLGIGLTLVRRLVELHGGTIDVASGGNGQGSTFTVRLPVALVEAPAPQEEPLRPASQARRVLLVDDNIDAREMYGLILRAQGHQVHEAEDGNSALDVFQRVRPDVAIVDIGLPGMNGYELARRLRSDPEGHDVRLIALTGYGFPVDRARSRAAGFNRHLVKPVSPHELLRELELNADSGAAAGPAR